jgi:hypothetical protein
MKRLNDPEQRDTKKAASVGPGAAAKMRVVIVEDPRVTARSMIEHDETDVSELWLQYFGNGGNALSDEFESLLYGMHEPSALDLDLLGLAVQELRAVGEQSRPSY